MNDRVTIYRYGPAAWVWRLLIVFFLVMGCLNLALALGPGGGGPLFIGAFALLAPALFFGVVVAVRVDRVGRDRLYVYTLLFFRRRLRLDELRPTKVRREYHDEHGVIDVPRLWVSVPRSVPIYLDLLGQIPSRMAFAATFGVPESALPGRNG